MSALPPDHRRKHDLIVASEDTAQVSRRGALKRLTGWSRVAIAAAMFGAGSSEASAKQQANTSSAPKGAWINGGGVNRGGGWINGGGWVNRSGGWINGGGGGGWVNRR